MCPEFHAAVYFYDGTDEQTPAHVTAKKAWLFPFYTDNVRFGFVKQLLSGG